MFQLLHQASSAHTFSGDLDVIHSILYQVFWFFFCFYVNLVKAIVGLLSLSGVLQVIVV